MAETENEATVKRRQNRYRLVVMNDDTYEEVITFRLSRLSVYVAFSTIFILLVGLTVALLVLTPPNLIILRLINYQQQTNFFHPTNPFTQA